MILITTQIVPKIDSVINAVIGAMTEVAIMLIFSSCVIPMYHKQPTDPPMPMWMRRIFLEKLSHLFRVTKRDIPAGIHGNPASNYAQFPVMEMRHLVDEMEENSCDVQQVVSSLSETSSSLMSKAGANGFSSNGQDTKGSQSDLAHQLDFIVGKIARDEKRLKIKEEWRIVAMTVDRLLVILFALVNIIIGIFCLRKIDH